MFLDDNPDYQTVWQLAHNWADADPDRTDTNAIPPKLRENIIRLVLAIRNKKISARTRKRSIFFDDSEDYSVLNEAMQCLHRVDRKCINLLNDTRH